MHYRILIVGTLGLAALLGLGTAARAQNRHNEAPPGFTSLFNGRDMSGWHGYKTLDPRKLAAMSEEERSRKLAEDSKNAEQHWKVDKGDLVSDGHGVHLATDKKYGDIELLIDYKTIPKADSGIYLRNSPQIQIWDSTPEGGNKSPGGDKGSGGLWNNSPGAPGKDPLVLADKPFGQWNHFRIIQVGTRTTVYLNDKLVVDHAIMENYWDRARKQPLVAKGAIELQTHGAEIRWRDIFVREIPPDEATSILEKHGRDGFQPIFDGKSLAGWAGAVDNYEVDNGAIRCKPAHGGVLYHNQELADFVARVEFRLPPGGNNGLAIRYPGGPGKGDAAYMGMTELQILDD